MTIEMRINTSRIATKSVEETMSAVKSGESDAVMRQKRNGKDAGSGAVMKPTRNVTSVEKGEEKNVAMLTMIVASTNQKNVGTTNVLTTDMIDVGKKNIASAMLIVTMIGKQRDQT
jgi:hypothetical protein